MKCSFKFLTLSVVAVGLLIGCGPIDKLKEDAKKDAKQKAIKAKMQEKLEKHCSGKYYFVDEKDDVYTFKCEFDANQSEEDKLSWEKECIKANTQILENTLVCSRKFTTK